MTTKDKLIEKLKELQELTKRTLIWEIEGNIYDYNQFKETANKLDAEISQLESELAKEKEVEIVTDSKITFEKLPDNTCVITVKGKNMHGDTFIRQEIIKNDAVYDALKYQLSKEVDINTPFFGNSGATVPLKEPEGVTAEEYQKAIDEIGRLQKYISELENYLMR